MAYLLIRGSDQANKGKFKKGLESHFSFENDKYTNTITVTVYALNKHQFDTKHYEQK